ncbi:hypothetical protein DSUL_50076 [Desulfovibrionales bacterium]
MAIVGSWLAAAARRLRCFDRSGPDVRTELPDVLHRTLSILFR